MDSYVIPDRDGTLTTAIETKLTEQAGRSMVLKSKISEVSLFIPLDLWETAERIRDQFRVQSGTILDHGDELNEFELVAAFMQHTLEARRALAREDPSIQVIPFLRTLFREFCGRFLKGNDPHAVFARLAKNLPIDQILRIFYDVESMLDGSYGNDFSALRAKHTPALFSEGSIEGLKDLRILAIFGGQGNTEDLLGELLHVYRTYYPLISDYFNALAKVLLECAEDQQSNDFLGKGFDVLKWIEDPESRPINSYLMKAPVSLPLVGLIQLLNYYVVLKVLKWTPEKLAMKLSGITGHSQGIISAAVIALSKTEKDFIENSQKAIRLLFWIGLRAQQAYPEATLSPEIIKDSVDNSEGMPTPMLAVSNLSLQDLQKQINLCNQHLPEGRRIELGLVNGPKAVVCCGPPQSLYGLNVRLRKLKAGPSEDQSRIPFSERKQKFSTRFLPISSPFHCSYLKKAVPKIIQDAARFGVSFSTSNLFRPVFHTKDGKNLSQELDLVKSLVEQICVDSVNWNTATSQAPLTHIIDFGPGHASGIGGLTHRNKDGSGVQIILAGTLESSNPNLQEKRHLFDTSPKSVHYAPNWKEQFGPKLTEGNGKVFVDTRFSRLLGLPPLMVAGMTPCTVSEKFCTAVINAGYHVELAGGGHFNEQVLRAKIDTIIEQVGIHCSITLNSLFLNPRLWAFQYPLVKTMRQEGYPIDGFTIAAGVPSFENACEVVESLRQAGIRHVSFKPGSTESISDVVKIAKANPKMPVIIQWTGGRGGGHHSFEDFHQPILETYSAIRAVSNLYLVAGSGFGDGEGSMPYLTGEWSLAYNQSPMPFDGILFASRVMVATENQASSPIKELIVKADGIRNESEWVKSYTGEVGGVVTVRSELGEPIHKIATRGVLLWKELDDTIFTLPKDKRMPAIRKKRDYLIRRFNQDHQKVWFGTKLSDGQSVDLCEMTYYEVCKRLGELCYVWHEKRWIDVTYKKLMHLFMSLIEERFVEKDTPSILKDHLDWYTVDEALKTIVEWSPDMVVEPFFNVFSTAKDTLLNPEDVQAFLDFCMIPWHKPVPFIPTLDDDKLEYWFKKDSLWQSEDLAAVQDQDPGRVCILHGPVAAAYSNTASQPVKEILDDINNYHIQTLLKSGVKVREELWFGGLSEGYPDELAKKYAIDIVDSDGRINTQFQLPNDPNGLPTMTQWLEILSGKSKSWLRALLRSQTIIQGPKQIVDNRLQALFRPRAGQLAEIEYIKDELSEPVYLKVSNEGREQLRCTFNPQTLEITVTATYYKAGNTPVPLVLIFVFDPNHPYGLIQERMADRNERIRQFYWNVWYGLGREQEYLAVKNFDVFNGVFESTSYIDQERVRSFCRIVGNHSESYLEGIAPMDYGMVACWEAVLKALFVDAIDGDILKLVHLSNSIEYEKMHHLYKIRPFVGGEGVKTKSRILAIELVPSGKTVSVEAEAFREGQCIMRVVSSFFFRGNYSNQQNLPLFKRTREPRMGIKVKNAVDLAILAEKPWIKIYPNDYLVGKGEKIEVHNLNIFTQTDPTTGSKSIECTGSIVKVTYGLRYEEIGKIDFIGQNLVTNPVVDYLNRAGTKIKEESYFDFGEVPMGVQESLEITSSASNQIYSVCSGDHNPIHTCPLFADLAGLPGTITHGLWTSAAVRSLVETFAAENQPLRVVKFMANFLDMVLPGEKLVTKLSHVGMINGSKLIKITTIVKSLNGLERKVLEGTAEVEPARTAYVFTGQGSQEIGMGMDLYASSPIAKEIWDRVDTHFVNNYGFSILEIIRKNPKTKQIHFGGPKGAKIRKFFMSMVYETVVNGQSRTRKLFPEITEYSTSYTFVSPAGLLSMTQFTQPAICIMEKVAFEVMRSKGLISPMATFAGHSLGEYAALACIGDIIGLETLCDVIFYRGMSMQVAIERDEFGRSAFGMAAVNPIRVQKGFNEAGLKFVVESVHKRTAKLLEIVNYNVQDWQYVVAGELYAIEVLTQTLNYIHFSKYDCSTLAKAAENPAILNRIEGSLFEIIDNVVKKLEEDLLKANAGYVTLQRGIASIPLSGIDVPFHSSFLLPGVGPFRAFLEKRFLPEVVEPLLLEDKYIPNLTASPFKLTREYVQMTYDVCKSPILASLLAGWTDEAARDPIRSRTVAAALIVELLAYQFASPVRWVETQHALFTLPIALELLIEIGPAPTLSGMAERTLRMRFEEFDDALSYRRTVLSFAKDRSEIFYESGVSAEAIENGTPEPSQPTNTLIVSSAVTVPVAEIVAPAAATNTQVIDTLPMEASEIIQIIICKKVKKPAAEVPLTKSLKELSGGKSTLQNELMADLQKEFGGSTIPERAEEMSLKDLANHLGGSGFSKAPGKYVSLLIAKMASSKFPAGFTPSSAKAFLNGEFALSPKACDTIFATALLTEPEGRLTSEEAAKSWLRTVSLGYFKAHGIELSSPASGGSGVIAAISSAELEKIQEKHYKFIKQQIELFAAYIKGSSSGQVVNSKVDTQSIENLQAELDYWTGEHGGQDYYDGIKPAFAPLKVRRYDSWWNWARQEALQLYQGFLNGEPVDPNVLSCKMETIKNRSDVNLIQFLEWKIAHSLSNDQRINNMERAHLAKHFGEAMLENARNGLDKKAVFRNFTQLLGPKTTITSDGQINYSEIPRSNDTSKNLTFNDYVCDMAKNDWLLLRSHEITDQPIWKADKKLTGVYFEALREMATGGVSFANRTVLMTGCGRNSIGFDILKGLLMGGAKVIITTSSYTRKNLDQFQQLFAEIGGRGASLTVVPFNQASSQDIENLVEFIYGDELREDLDTIIPFAAISEVGRSLIDGIDARSELAHRMMLTNVLRLLGAIAKAKEKRGIITRPAQVILPLSPNHGAFGYDGLYGESKAALETLFQKWHSEAWQDYLTIVGAVIGWTRGTGLMNDNNLVAEEIERDGKVRTFSVAEMAYNILGLLHPKIIELAECAPVYADLNGGMNRIADLHKVTRVIRDDLQAKASLARGRYQESLADGKNYVSSSAASKQAPIVRKRSNFDFTSQLHARDYEKLPNKNLKLGELLDLKQVVVVTGFGEVGPWGNARTRWEMEAYGEFSIEGCIQLAWIMGLIKFQPSNKPAETGGWIDASTGEKVHESQVKEKYEEAILKHCGIRLIEPVMFEGYDPLRKFLTQEVVLNEDMKPIEVSQAEADQFKRQHGDLVQVFKADGLEDGRVLVRFLKGATLFIPKALRFDRFVAGQIPTGWNAERYGVPKDIIDQVDPVTLFVLVSTVEALVSSGITDPYEFYQYVHLAEVGNTSGGGVGGQRSNQKIFRSRFLDKPVQSDILQESFINTMPAWVNLLLLSSAGPIKTPVGACATAVESIDIGVETILSGKAQIIIAGGYDDFREEGSFEFASMEATSNAETEVAKGREPNEMSRPMASSRAGFMESQGAGIQILMTAELALQMGCPIYGIIAAVNTATDKEGRSVPAPGQGILTTARRIVTAGVGKPRILDIDYRVGQLRKAKASIDAWMEEELATAAVEAASFVCKKESSAFLAAATKDIQMEAMRRLKSEQRQWGGFDFAAGDPRIAPVEAALSRFGLTVDDIGVASFHGTGTKANDVNESEVLQKQMEHLGRQPGNLLPAVCQKYLTGHPKAAAAAWMLNGTLQIINTGIIPPNRNADNIEAKLQNMTMIIYPTKALNVGSVKAGLLKSFGFGQVGGEVLVLHPNILLGTLSRSAYEAYLKKRQARDAKAHRYTYEALIGQSQVAEDPKLIKLKTGPPFAADLESQAYLDPTVRASFNPVTGSWAITKANLDESKTSARQVPDLAKALFEAAGGERSGLGVDVQLVTDLPVDNQDFLQRNFTKAELEHCLAQPDVPSSLAGRWAAKEAVVKALCSVASSKPDWLGGPGAPLNAIEVLPGSPAPTVKFGPLIQSPPKVKVSISHSGEYAVAIATVMHV